MSRTVVLSNITTDLTRILGDAEMLREAGIFLPESLHPRLKLRFGPFELRDLTINLSDGCKLVIPRLLVESLELRGQMTPVRGNDGQTVRAFEYQEADTPVVVASQPVP